MQKSALLNNKRLFMQVSTILREFIGMTTISQVTILSLWM